MRVAAYTCLFRRSYIRLWSMCSRSAVCKQKSHITIYSIWLTSFGTLQSSMMLPQDSLSPRFGSRVCAAPIQLRTKVMTSELGHTVFVVIHHMSCRCTLRLGALIGGRVNTIPALTMYYNTTLLLVLVIFCHRKLALIKFVVHGFVIC